MIAYLLLVFGMRTNPVDGATMVRIPGGEFVMGSSAEDIDRVWRKFGWPEAWKQHTQSEQPARRVRVSGFWIYRDDVTVAQYRRFCRATRRTMPPAPEWGWHENHPVVNVSWHDAKAYCAWAKGRLPSEAEWEYAARGGKAHTIFGWGDDFPTGRVANVADESYKKARHYNSNFRLFGLYNDGYTYTSPVDAFPANGYGLRDMAGNVWQWCEDRSDAARRVLRGGAYDTPPEMTRVARRVGNSPDVHHDEKGFRVVVSL